jgi:cystathionine beta-lyase/cystathionine gamma-synthase
VSARSRSDRAASANAIRLAEFLQSQDKVVWVRYPGLPSHPDHAVASRLIDGPGGAMLAFQVRGGVDGMAAFTDHLALCDLGVSLGDVFTLVYPQPKRDGLIRVSVGCEDIEDLIEDFTRGLSFVA